MLIIYFYNHKSFLTIYMINICICPLRLHSSPCGSPSIIDSVVISLIVLATPEQVRSHLRPRLGRRRMHGLLRPRTRLGRRIHGHLRPPLWRRRIHWRRLLGRGCRHLLRGGRWQGLGRLLPGRGGTVQRGCSNPLPDST